MQFKFCKKTRKNSECNIKVRLACTYLQKYKNCQNKLVRNNTVYQLFIMNCFDAPGKWFPSGFIDYAKLQHNAKRHWSFVLSAGFVIFIYKFGGCSCLIPSKLTRLPADPLEFHRDRPCSRAGRDRQPCRLRLSGIFHRGNTAPYCTCRPCTPLERQ